MLVPLKERLKKHRLKVKNDVDKYEKKKEKDRLRKAESYRKQKSSETPDVAWPRPYMAVCDLTTQVQQFILTDGSYE